MSHTSEKNRRKDSCKGCNNFKPIKAKGLCQNCWHKIKRKTQPNFYLRSRYSELRQRCINPNNTTAKNYNGFDFCTRQEFLDRFLTDSHFLKLFQNWISSGYDYCLTPSIDRINPTFGYTLDNIQFLTHSQNCTKDQPATPITAYKNGQSLDFPSQGEASRILKLPQSNIWKVLNKERNTCGGYTFEYKT